MRNVPTALTVRVSSPQIGPSIPYGSGVPCPKLSRFLATISDTLAPASLFHHWFSDKNGILEKCCLFKCKTLTRRGKFFLWSSLQKVVLSREMVRNRPSWEGPFRAWMTNESLSQSDIDFSAFCISVLVVPRLQTIPSFPQKTGEDLEARANCIHCQTSSSTLSVSFLPFR